MAHAVIAIANLFLGGLIGECLRAIHGDVKVFCVLGEVGKMLNDKLRQDRY